MTAPTEDVDWAAVERGRRGPAVLAVVAIAALLGSMVALQGGYAGFEGAAGWVAVGILAALGVVGALVARAWPGSGARIVRARRVQYALRHHVDPGDPLRSEVDVAARRLIRVRWAVWYSPLVVVALLAGAQWERPAVAVPAALVLVGLVVAWAVVTRRQVQAAQRWTADPPGPPRELPGPSAVKRWTSPGRLLLTCLGVGVVGGVIGFAIARIG